MKGKLHFFFDRLFRHSRLDREMDEEIRAHIELRAAELQQAGLSWERARRRARLDFGGAENYKEQCRDQRSFHLLHDLVADLRYGLRMLRKAPGFTAVAVITLALGIGATTAIFTVVNAVLFRPFSFDQPDRLAMLTTRNAGRNITRNASYPNFADARAQNHTLDAVAAYGYWPANLRGEDKPVRVPAALVTGDFFRVLGTPALLGRTLAPEDDTAAGAPVTVLSYGLWRRRFGADSGIIGRTVTVNGAQVTVVGVMPESLAFPFPYQLWLPIHGNEDPARLSSRGTGWLRVIGRLKSTATLQQAQADLNTVAAQLAQDYPGENKGWGISVAPLQQVVLADVRPALLVLLAAVALVLLIACLNISGLLLARGGARSKEIGIRCAVGASRGRLLRQMLTESVLLALLGGLAGVLLAYWGLHFLLPLLAKAGLPRLADVQLDWGMLGFSAGVSLAGGVFFGAWPAWRTSRLNLNGALKDGKVIGPATPGRCSRRSWPVVGELALSLVLLISAGLLLRTFLHLRAVEPGFNPDHVATFTISFTTPSSPSQASASSPETRQAAEQAQTDLFVAIARRTRSLPGVTAAGAVTTLPLSGTFSSNSFHLVGAPPEPGGHGPEAGVNVVLPGYLEAMQIPVLSGRLFTDRDDERAPQVAIVNQEFVRRFLPGQNPIGKQLITGGRNHEPREVVGVTGDVRHFSLGEPVRPEIYLPLPQQPWPNMTFVVRSSRDPAALFPEIQKAVWSLDKDQPIGGFRSMEELVSDSLFQHELESLLVGLFAATALVLAMVGIYGVISHSVSLRIHEFGIRLALGATRTDVLVLVISEALRFTVAGIVLGAVLTMVAGRILRQLLFGVKAGDPLTIAVVCGLLAGAALVAAFVPARRAARLDPVVALRYE